MSKKAGVETIPQFISAFSLLIGSVIIIFVSAILIFAAIGFVFGYSITAGAARGAAIISIIYAAWGITQYYRRNRLYQFTVLVGLILIVLLIFAASMYVAGKFYDLSWDGLSYHASGMIQLIEGWNPFHDPPLKDNIPQGYIFDSPALNYYTKGPYYASVALYKVTGSLEKSKVFNFLLAAASFFLGLSMLLSTTGLKPYTAAILSGVLALNPVVIYQALTFYVDGQLASLLTCLICLLLLLSRQANKIIYITLGLVLILITNVKLTGLVYAAILCGGYFFWLLFVQRKTAKNFTIAMASGFLVGTLLVGYNPFVTNTIGNNWGLVKGAAIIYRNIPKPLKGKGLLEKLVISLFSQSTISREETRLKLPFTVSSLEENAFHFYDIRIGGFGPLFSGALVITLALLLYQTILKFKTKKLGRISPAVLLFVLVLASVFSNPDAWWARYVPQFWVIPGLAILVAFAGVATESKWHRRLTGFLSYLLIFVLCINCMLVYRPQVIYQYDVNKILKNQLTQLQTRSTPVEVNFTEFVGNRFRFDALGIEYTSVEELSCPDPANLPAAGYTLYCEDE